MQVIIPAVVGLHGLAQNGKLLTGDQIATVKEAATSIVPMQQSENLSRLLSWQCPVCIMSLYTARNAICSQFFSAMDPKFR